MKISHRIGIPLVVLVVLLIAGGLMWQHHVKTALSIRVGILHALTGPMAANENNEIGEWVVTFIPKR